MRKKTRRAPSRLQSPERRQALQVLGSIAGCAVALEAGSLLGCSPAPEGPQVTKIPLDELPEGKRHRVLHGEEPVEIIRAGDEVRARSLWCTHVGCEVQWQEQHREYTCPCHNGRYDERGRVLEGPPPSPLRELSVRVADKVVILGESQIAG